jgi:hypothetical protein
MTTLFYLVIAFFVAANVAVEYRNRKSLPPFRSDLSAYLAGVPWFWLQDLGYLALAVCFPLIGERFGGLAVEILFDVSAFGLVVVVLTKDLIAYSGLNPLVKGDLEIAHVAAAGLTFGLLTVALLVHSWLEPSTTFVAALLAPLSAAAFNRLAPKKTALEEKAYTLFLLIAILAAL